VVQRDRKQIMKANISKSNIFSIEYFLISFFLIEDQCYCCQFRLNGKSIQFARRSQPFGHVDFYKRPCIQCRNLILKQIKSVR